MTSEAIAAAAATVSAIVALCAIAVTFYQSRLHHDQSIKLSQYISITQRVFDVDMLFIQNPQLRRYFYDNQIVDQLPDIERITAVAEYILDFYSTIQEHERILATLATPSWKEWRTFIADGFRGSPFLCVYYDKNATWYEEGLMEIYRPVAKERHDVLVSQRTALTKGTA